MLRKKVVSYDISHLPTRYLVIAMVVKYREQGVTCSEIQRIIDKHMRRVHDALQRHHQYGYVVRVPATAIGIDDKREIYYFPTPRGIEYFNYIVGEKYNTPQVTVEPREGYYASDFNL